MKSLSFLDTVLDVHAEPGTGLDGALEFLGTHVAVDAPGALGEPVLSLHLSAAPGERHAPAADAAWEDVHVRKSASDFFTIPARRAREDGCEYVHCTRTGTRFRFDRAARRIDAAVPPGGAMDLVELLRDVILKDQENRGAAVLHATCAEKDGRAVLATGAKGAGKSTLLLELVEHFGHRVMSGDKTVLRLEEDGRVLAAGWPDYPHLGYGTIAKYPGLPDIAGLGEDHVPPVGHAFSPLGKFAVDPRRFRERFPGAPLGTRAPVAVILHPAIGPGQDTEVAAYRGDRAEHAAVLAANVESAFEGAHAGWHGFLDDRRDAAAPARDRIVRSLAGVPAWTVTGPGDLRPGRVPALLSAEAIA
ncbi:hypothetical protein [Nocardiopsis sp. CC223A]|uniref:hypothetical protein n=1 Tax=Nocardiopsis sp. CC223A TaxID=3044051 RepID=UPI00278C05A5|nr:hypothetical protein [Nocardiopsis sp. CC223A]